VENINKLLKLKQKNELESLEKLFPTLKYPYELKKVLDQKLITKQMVEEWLNN
jgi:hypothetical protein